VITHSPKQKPAPAKGTHIADPTWGDFFETSFKAQNSKLERLFSLKRGKRDLRALIFEL